MRKRRATIVASSHGDSLGCQHAAADFSHEDQKVLLQLHEDNRFDDDMGHIRKQA